ncbi:hypothetical protein Tco_0185687 [Tanacetum coccineum]
MQNTSFPSYKFTEKYVLIGSALYQVPVLPRKTVFSHEPFHSVPSGDSSQGMLFAIKKEPFVLVAELRCIGDTENKGYSAEASSISRHFQFKFEVLMKKEMVYQQKLFAGLLEQQLDVVYQQELTAWSVSTSRRDQISTSCTDDGEFTT